MPDYLKAVTNIPLFLIMSKPVRKKCCLSLCYTWLVAGDIIGLWGVPLQAHAWQESFGALVFSEVMADPDPSVGLPAIEYLELYNRTDHPISLAGWQLGWEGGSCLLPYGIVKGGNYAVITSESAALMLDSGLTVLGCRSFPVLPNTGRLYYLKAPDGTLVAWFQYASSWVKPLFKQHGGWSLECVDVTNLSGRADNWRASTDPLGGTPGRANSVASSHPDTVRPVCCALYVLDSCRLELAFSKGMELIRMLWICMFSTRQTFLYLSISRTNWV